MPAFFERKSAMFEEQVDVPLRNMEDKGIKRIYATQAEIDRTRIGPVMLAIGETVDHDVEDCLKIVKISTYSRPGSGKRWLRKRRGGEKIQKTGRKRSTPAHIIELILRFVKENPGWRIRRIVGELWKLKYKISNSTVYKICKDNGVPMPPKRCKRKPFSSWFKFVRANMESIVACGRQCRLTFL